AICPFKLHCNPGRSQTTQTGFLRPSLLSRFLFFALLLLGWPRDDFVAGATLAGALASLGFPADQHYGRFPESRTAMCI
ncbi:hypothetical protein NL493_28660, partial [Klebsiella pneumoniae]|nr:hypothetical protein [Klebsiella pneumoniae]